MKNYKFNTTLNFEKCRFLKFVQLYELCWQYTGNKIEYLLKGLKFSVFVFFRIFIKYLKGVIVMKYRETMLYIIIIMLLVILIILINK